MKRVLTFVLILLLVFPQHTFAYDATAEFFTGETYTNDPTATLDGWQGSIPWYIEDSVRTPWITGSVMGTHPGFSGSAVSGFNLYTAGNFGADYHAEGDAFLAQNQVFVYFNTTADLAANLITGGYRGVISIGGAVGKVALIEQYKNGAWMTAKDENGNPAQVSLPASAENNYKYHFSLTVVQDGTVEWTVANSDDVSVTTTAALGGVDYISSGYFGIGCNASRMMAGKLVVDYNRAAAYTPPALVDTSVPFGEFSVYPAGQDMPVWAELTYGAKEDIKKAVFIVDQVNYTPVLNEEEKKLVCTIPAAALTWGMHTAKLVIVDKMDVSYELCEGRFFAGDCQTVFDGFSKDGDQLTAQFRYRQTDDVVQTLTAAIVVYQADGVMAGMYTQMLQDVPSDGTEISVSVSAPVLTDGQSAQSFLFEDMANPAPLSGVYGT